MREAISERVQSMRRALLQLNLFASTPPSTDQHERKDQLISTRLFIVLFIGCLAVLLVYTSAISFSETRAVLSPTLQQYHDLYNTYSEALSCPCSKITIDYAKFLQINYTMHQVCSNDFISEQWITNFYRSLINITMSPMDFRVTGLFAFQALHTLCTLPNDHIVNSLTRFDRNQYVRMDITPVLLFQPEMQSVSDSFRTSTRIEFLSSLKMVREVSQMNFYLTATQSNAWIYRTANPVQYKTAVRTLGNCSCLFHRTCTQPSAIYNGLTDEILFEIDGMKTGCFVIEGLLQSNLNCFYDSNCLKQMNAHLDNILINLTVISVDRDSRFSSLSTVQELLQELFVEKWNLSVRYANYYAACQPNQCSFVIRARNDVISIFTRISGLVGGLITGLTFVVPLLVSMVRKKRNHTTEMQSKR